MTDNTILIPALETVNGAVLMSEPLMPVRFVVDTLLPQGLHLLAGAPKRGKSWMALQICLAVACGEAIWSLKTTRGDALYLCLEDSRNRIQNRLFDSTDDAPENIHFATLSKEIGNGLENQIEQFVLAYPDTVLIVIDTLQKVRLASGDNAYANDYRDIGQLKQVADRLGICILLIHHLRKQYDSDPMNMVSGTAGITGAVDGSFVLREKADEGVSILHCTGRDIESRELKLQFDKPLHHWNVVADSITQPEKFFDNIFAIIRTFLDERGSFCGSPSELTTAVQPYAEEKVYSSALSKKLLQSKAELDTLGIHYSSRHSNGKRLVELRWL